MTLDHLLLWLSARGQGSWSQFRSGVEQLCSEFDSTDSETHEDSDPVATAGAGLPVYQRVRLALQRLGHAEFFYNPEGPDWRVVPPTLALFPRRPNEGVLCGARSPDLLLRLASAYDVASTPAAGMPNHVLVRGSAHTLEQSAARLGLFLQMDAPLALLSAAPLSRNPTMWATASIPESPGWTVHRFSSSRLRWIDSTGPAALLAQFGFFRFVMRHQRYHYLRWHGCSYRVAVQVGKYAVLRRRRALLMYNATDQTLSLPAICRPPLLIDRALVLCSGLLPAFHPASGRLRYSNVRPELARLAAALLRQELHSE